MVVLAEDRRPPVRRTKCTGSPSTMPPHVQTNPIQRCARRAPDPPDRRLRTGTPFASDHAQLRGADLAQHAVELLLPARPDRLQRPPARGLRRPGAGDPADELAQARARADDLREGL